LGARRVFFASRRCGRSRFSNEAVCGGGDNPAEGTEMGDISLGRVVSRV